MKNDTVTLDALLTVIPDELLTQAAETAARDRDGELLLVVALAVLARQRGIRADSPRILRAAQAGAAALVNP